MTPLIDFKRVTYSSWFHLFALLFYATRIIEINSIGLELPWFLIFVLVLLFFVVLIVDHKLSSKGNQGISDVVSICSTAVLAFYIGLMLSGEVNALQEVLVLPAILFFCFHFWILTKDSSFSANKWTLVQGKLTRFVLERKMILIEPSIPSVTEQHEGILISNVEYVARIQLGIKTTHSNPFFDGHSSNINFEDQAYVFATSNSEGRKRIFNPPSHPGLQAFDPLVDTKLFFGMDRLRQNTLNQLLICNIIQHINTGRLKEAIDVLRYTSQKQIFSLELKCNDKGQVLEPILVKHNWKIRELGMCGKHILASFDEQKGMRNHRINTMVVSIFKEINQHKPHYFLTLISFFSLLARLEQDNERPQDEKWIGAINTFSHGIHTVLERYEHAEPFHSGKKLNLSFNIIKNKISDIGQFLDACSDQAIDQFIIAHDNYVAYFLESMPDDGTIYDELLEQILDTMMGQLGRTQRKQRLAKEGKYSFEQLINLRTGQIIGATILIRLLTDLEKEVKS